jgi:hypothetical protein
MSAATVYPPRRVKRSRRTNAQLAELDAAIVRAVEDDSPVSLRGVYYRVLAAGAIEKTDSDYDAVGRELLKLRRAQVIPYSAITDGTRWISKPRSFNSIDEALEDTAAGYRRALWHDSVFEVMVFSEKDSISGIVYPVTAKWDVPLGVMRGDSSETFAYAVAEAIVDAIDRDKSVKVYQLGDHDPSGVRIWSSFVRKVSTFTTEMLGGMPVDETFVDFERLAVNLEQIETLGLIGHETKGPEEVRAAFGDSYDVDAIPAKELRRVVEDAILDLIDPHALAVTQIYEKSERDILTKMAASFGGAP